MSAPRTFALERDQLHRSRRRFEFDPSVLVAAGAVLALAALALFGEHLAPHEPIYFVLEHGNAPRPYEPGVVFPLGSDVLGRDIVSLVLAGAASTLTIIFTGGIARVTAGIAIAALGTLWRPMRLVTETAAEFVAAIPATLVALVAVKILVKADTTVLVFVAALLLVGWAGPFRVVRAELDRLAHAPFTVGALALGVSGWRLFWRHQLPHLVPVITVNLAQQVVASLVLVAELGVLGTFVGTTRLINVEESLSRVVTGPPSLALIADPPEWGGLLASARTVEILWTTRWLILVPGVAFALTAIAVSVIGIAVSRRYARRDVTDDVRGIGTILLVTGLLVMFVVSALLPERYADARPWAAAARAASTAAPFAPADLPAAFADAGMVPVGQSFAVTRETSGVIQTAGASVTVATQTVAERWPRDTVHAQFGGEVRSFVSAATGGGVVDAPLVFVGRGIAPKTDTGVFRPRIGLQLPDLESLLRSYPDDYAAVDVRGKVVMLVRFAGFRHETFDDKGRPKTRQIVGGYPQEDAITSAIAHGAAAVLFVDPDLPVLVDANDPSASSGQPNPYTRVERAEPATTSHGVPVVVLSASAASTLVASLAASISTLVGQDDFGRFDGMASVARELGVSARVTVPLEQRTTRATTVVGAVPGIDPTARSVLVWTVAAPTDGPRSTTDVIATVARALAGQRVPFIFVAFDPTGDAVLNKRQVAEALASRHIGLVLVLVDLEGDALQFTTPNGDLIPAFDLYAERAGVKHVVTHATAGIAALGQIAPLQNVPTVLIEGRGDSGDLRADARALLGYIAGRYALGAEELVR